MPTPEELEKLNEAYLGEYNQLIGIGADPDATYQKIFAAQQREMDAKKRLTQEAEINETVKTGQTDKIPQDICRAPELCRYHKRFVMYWILILVTLRSNRSHSSCQGLNPKYPKTDHLFLQLLSQCEEGLYSIQKESITSNKKQ